MCSPSPAARASHKDTDLQHPDECLLVCLLEWFTARHQMLRVLYAGFRPRHTQLMASLQMTAPFSTTQNSWSHRATKCFFHRNALISVYIYLHLHPYLTFQWSCRTTLYCSIFLRSCICTVMWHNSLLQYIPQVMYRRGQNCWYPSVKGRKSHNGH